jgi:hypothetical protein
LWAQMAGQEREGEKQEPEASSPIEWVIEEP